MNLSPKRLISSVSMRLERATYRAQGKKVIHLIHIGKTGGTAIKEALLPYRNTTHQILVLHPHQTKLRDIPPGDRFMFFLRDPISRFISAFYSRKRQGQPRRFSKWSEEEKIAFRLFSTPNVLAKALSSGDAAEREAAERAMRGISHVKDSFWTWFGNKDEFLSRKDDIFFIGFQETLSQDFATLVSMLHLPSEVSLPSDPVRAHRNPQDLDVHLDEDAINNLRVWFCEEWNFIALCRDLKALSR